MRILLVDDCPDINWVLKELLQREGHEVRVSESGGDAILASPDFLPEVVCLDLGLPDMDGYQLAAQLRCVSGAEKACFIAMTGSDADPFRLKEAGIDHHMLKPVNFADVLIAIAGVSHKAAV